MKYSSNPNPKTLPGATWLFAFLALVIAGLVMPSVATAGRNAQGSEPVFGADVSNAPDWLAGPTNTHELYSEYKFSSLAGHLIAYGDVDASSCVAGPFLESGAANECGMSLAQPAVNVWQNRFNSSILLASQETGVPPIVIKNIFAWESQFWPNTIYVNTYEYGFGHITEAGADSAMRWNSAFYTRLCRENFSAETCATRYADQPVNIRAAMMGVVVKLVKADCAECAYGLDLAKADKSVSVFAETILANANLVNMTVSNLTGKPAIKSVSYEDLWKFSLASYNAGPGCFVTAFSRTLHNYKDLNWENFSAQLDPACRGAVRYVEFISSVEQYFPENDPTIDETVTPEVTVTEAPTEIPTDAATATEGTPEPTAEETGTPTPEETGTGVTPTEVPTETETPVTETPTATEELPDEVVEQLEPPHVTDQVLLRLDPLYRQEVLDLLGILGIDLVRDGNLVPSLDALVIQVDAGQLGDVLAVLQSSEGILIAEPNYLAALATLPNDPEIGSQPGLWSIQAPQAWNALPSMQEALVAVLDTGIDLAHPDLASSLWQNAGEVGLDENGIERSANGLDDDGNGYVDDWQGWNMISGSNDASDDQGHGTHLAGIIGASVNNAIGVAGVAPNARLLPVKVLDNTGYGTYTQVAEGIRYAVDMGARVINMGFAGLGSSQVLQEAVDYATAHGVLVVAAAGNGGMNTTYYPAAYPGVIAVGSVDSVLNWSPFSSSGEHISLVAPGVGIYSTYLGGTYRAFSGTSASSAHVSGVIALLAGQPEFGDTDMLRSALLGSSVDLGSPGKDPYFGYGIVHACDALGYAGPILPTATPWIVPTSTGDGLGGVVIQALEDVWGLTQTSTYAILNSANSIDSAFNDQVASSTGPFGGAASRTWTFTSIGNTTFTSIAAADLEVRFYITGWVDDVLRIQVYDPSLAGCGGSWCTVKTITSTPVNSSQMLAPNTLTTVTIPVSTILNTVTKVNNAQMRFNGTGIVGAGADNITIFIDEVRLHLLDVLPTATPTPLFMPTATLPPSRAMTATPAANEPHSNFMSLTTEKCADCHRTHTSKAQILRGLTGEEMVCFACHTTGGTGTNVQPAFSTNPNTLTRFFSHPVFDQVNVHLPNENIGADFAGADRHVECEDCHSPHASGRTDPPGVVAAPATQQEAYESGGVDPTWDAAGVASTLTWVAVAEREFQICFKCHSSFTTLPTYLPAGYGYEDGNPTIGFLTDGLAKLTTSNPLQVPDSRDMAQEFNPWSASYHPVSSLGRNQNMPPGSFVAGWSQTSMVYCTDCHTTPGSAGFGDGPHGSSLLHLLDGTYNYITRSSNDQSDPIHDSGELCFKCHSYAIYNGGSATGTYFRDGSENLHGTHDFASCYTCHDTHGSEQLHLINFDTSVVTPDAGYNSQSAWVLNPATGERTCYLGCHTVDHGTGKSYTP